MVPRLGSPALSENEFDISKALYDQSDDEASDFDLEAPPNLRNPVEPLSNGANAVQDLGLEGHEDSSDDEAYIAAQQAASNRKAANVKGKSVKKGGGFQAMGLNSLLLKAITRKGFTVPTPIQRKAVPVIMGGQDVVGMARTGSGKTAAFVIPMVEKLKTHSVKVGARGVIMSPSRELALQTLKVVKELGKGTSLRTVLLVGGDSLEDQFGSMTSNPDIIIATPGRFMHLKVEMGLDLSAVQYIVFDEADRLFEMGFAAQLTEILHALPQARQTLLFSATLPKSLVEFARAGLQDPTLIRLDAESKLSPDLQSAFFTLKSADKDGALLHILQDVIKMPLGATEASLNKKTPETFTKKRKRSSEGPKHNPNEAPTEFSTIIFTATKHHVEYVSTLLRCAGYAVSYVYGSLDQTARKMQVQEFRAGLSNILVVTDVAARGIDMPVLANVINYDFPPQPKVFIHRVGRTARAGQRGWSYSLVRDSDMPYLLDLQLFLSKKLVLGRSGDTPPSFSDDVVVGSLVRDKVGKASEWINRLLDEDEDLANLRTVAAKGEKLYMKTRNSASNESAKRSRDVFKAQATSDLNWLFSNESNDAETEREKMLARVSDFRPSETTFEIGKRGSGGEAAEIMRKRREKIETRRPRPQEAGADDTIANSEDLDLTEIAESADLALEQPESDADDDDDEMEVTVSQSQPSKGTVTNNAWEDPEHFMSYAPKSLNLVEDKGYGVHSGSNDASGRNSNFLEASRGATMDLNNDESKAFGEATRARGMRWDKKNKKYVARANDEDGSKGTKMIRGESGQKIAATFRSGRFDTWKKNNKIERMPRTGEQESSRAMIQGISRQYRHKAERAPKEADKYRDDYYKQKKKVGEAKEKRIGKFKDGSGKNELRGVDDVRKDRKLKERRQEKHGRPPKRRKA